MAIHYTVALPECNNCQSRRTQKTRKHASDASYREGKHRRGNVPKSEPSGQNAQPKAMTARAKQTCMGLRQTRVGCIRSFRLENKTMEVERKCFIRGFNRKGSDGSVQIR